MKQREANLSRQYVLQPNTLVLAMTGEIEYQLTRLDVDLRTQESRVTVLEIPATDRLETAKEHVSRKHPAVAMFGDWEPFHVGDGWQGYQTQPFLV